jgi:hypothetical protein
MTMAPRLGRSDRELLAKYAHPDRPPMAPSFQTHRPPARSALQARAPLHREKRYRASRRGIILFVSVIVLAILVVVLPHSRALWSVLLMVDLLALVLHALWVNPPKEWRER